ncbi:MAG: hypothetical protein Q7T55_07035, partial [Solirubrobacteraceae bacterium]|nr:hypothetical protein [Solirubrobacteraceae bacterium]
MATTHKPPQPAPPDRRFADVVLPAPRHKLTRAAPVVPDLGPLKDLPGLWVAEGTGWNMIALPFQGAPAGAPKYRILMNQYDEQLKFDFVDDSIKNRGLLRSGDPDFDQVVAGIDYQQKISQIDAEDFPKTNPDLAGPPHLAIHHEPGLWLWEKNRRVNDDHIDQNGVS